MESLHNKVALITGGTRGIGFRIAEKLLAHGAKVVVCGVDQERLDSALAKLRVIGPAAGAIADVSRLADVKRLVAMTMETFGNIDILVNNAALRTYRPITELEPAEWERMLAVNLTGAFYCSREVLPIFKQNRSGDVINISSLAGAHAFAGGSGYNASKFGLNGLSDATLLDHRQDGIRVSCIMPGSVDTDEKKTGEASRDTSWKIAPEDIADVVALLLQMPRRTTISRVEVRPTMPSGKA